MRQRILIGLAGPAGAGKSTAAALLVAEAGFVRIGIADPIRAAACRYFGGITSVELEHQKRHDPWVRRFMRTVGDAMTGLQWDVLLRAAEVGIAEAWERQAPGIVVEDVRKELEADWLRTLGGTLVHVHRDGVAYTGDHATECGPVVDADDLVLNNPGEIAPLRGALFGVVADLCRRQAA